MKRGIFFTFMIFLLFSSLLLYVLEISKVYSARKEIPLYDMHISRMSYVADDISTDVSQIYGIGYSPSLGQNHTTYRYMFSHRTGLNPLINKYFSFINSTYREQGNFALNITLERTFANISCDDGIFVLRNFTSLETLAYANTSRILNSSIELYTDASFSNDDEWSEVPGHANVSLVVRNPSGTIVDRVYSLRKTILNTYYLNFTTGEIYIEFGNVGAGEEGIRIRSDVPYDANVTVVSTALPLDNARCKFEGSQLSYVQQVAAFSGPIRLTPGR
mgnify:CR=1 FL=1